MRNKKSLLSYVAIPIFGVSVLAASCELNTSNKSQIYDLKVSDVNEDGLKDLTIRDSKGDIKDVYVQTENGDFISSKEAYWYNLMDKIDELDNTKGNKRSPFSWLP